MTDEELARALNIPVWLVPQIDARVRAKYERLIADERPEGCECNKRLGDYEWCPVHGKDPDDALDEQRERQWDNFR